MQEVTSRREWLKSAGAALAGAWLAGQSSGFAGSGPSARVALSKCSSYGSELIPTLEKMIDQLGGLGRLVRGKTVAVKLNLTGEPSSRVGHTPVGSAQWVHPNLIGAFIVLLDKAGARRIRLLESAFRTDDPLEEVLLQANWEPRHLLNAAAHVEFENTNYLGKGKKYSRLWVPGDGLMFSGFDVNHSYEECDVFVSLAKLKEHYSAGVTLSMKNCFGITPCTIYGDGAGEDEPSPRPRGGRALLHTGYRKPSQSAPQEIRPSGNQDDGYRLPRIVVDLVRARPIHLAIIDGIESMFAGEGPWIPGVGTVRPGVLIAGTNCVSTDAVATAVMGFDPRAQRGSPPFERCDSTLLLAEMKGLGSCNLKDIEVTGATLRDVQMNYRSLRSRRLSREGEAEHGIL